MDTDKRVPAPPTEMPLTASVPRGRRWRKVLSLVLVLMVLAGGTAFGIFVATYRPLAEGSLYGTDGGRFRDVDDPGSDQRPRRVFRYEHGAGVLYFFGIRNEGPFGVTITGIDIRNDSGLLVGDSLLLGGYSDDWNYGLQPQDAFEPFPLEAGQERVVGVRAHFANCGRMQEGSSAAFDSRTVAYRFLGMEHFIDVSMTVAIEVEALADGDCPESGPARV